MKTTIRLLLFICLISFCIKSFSQDFWEEIDFPYNSSIYSITVNEDGIIYLGCENGVYSSGNDGVDWDYLLSDGIIHSMAHCGNIVYAGGSITQYVDKYWRSENSGVTWDTIYTNIEVYGNVMAQLSIGDTLFSSIWTDMSRLIRSYDYGLTWELVFSSETITDYISDIAITEDQTLFFGIKSYGENIGGVYKSTDFGENWEFAGLQHHSVSSMAVNSNGDVFAGVWGGEQGAMPGLYVLRSGETDWDTLIMGTQVEDLVINNIGDIYFSSTWPNGVIRSLDNGETFDLINDGLPIGPMGYLTIDNQGYLYITSHYVSNFLAKSVQTTVSLPDNRAISSQVTFTISPNPAKTSFAISNNDNRIISDVRVYNQLGQVVFHKKFISNNIDVSTFDKGLYIVEFTTKNERIRKKLIIQ